MKKVKVERKLYLDRSRSLYLKNIKMRKQIEQIKKIISESEPVQTSQPKISLFFEKKSKPRQIVN